MAAGQGGHRHPEHDRLVRALRGWYTTSYPAMGYHTERRGYGYYTVNSRIPGGLASRVLLRDVAPEQVPECLADARRYFGDAPAAVVVDDRQVDAQLGPALLAAGCAREGTLVYLAHVGPLPRVPGVPGLMVEPVDEANLGDYCVTKRKGFAGDEAEPPAEAVEVELAFRRAEMAGEGRFLLARLDGEPAAIVAWYEGSDRSLFLLATRVPFRGRGIARWLLGHVLADAEARGCRSVIINADPDDTPIQLYRRLGFADEVGWQRRYALPPTGLG